MSFLTRSELQVLPGSKGLLVSTGIDLQTPLLAVMAMAFLVLLIAAVNVASLLLVRSAARVREFSLRYALGANARRVVQQLLLEGVLIGIAGGAAGLLIAPVCIRVLVHRLDLGRHHGVLDDAGCSSAGLQLCDCVGGECALQPGAGDCSLLRPDIVNSLEATDFDDVWRRVELSASHRFAAGRARAFCCWLARDSLCARCRTCGGSIPGSTRRT